MFSRDGLFIRFSNARIYPYIISSIDSLTFDIVICCWDLASNAIGRAYVLAEMLARDHFRVLVIAPSKGPNGCALWPPLSRSIYSFDVLTFAYRSEDEFFNNALFLARKIHSDIVIASKTRPQSCLTAFLFGLHQDVSIFCDVDDYESAFYGNTISMKQWKDSINLSNLYSFVDSTSLFNDERWINISSLIADTFDDYIFACESMRTAYSNNYSPIVFHKRYPYVDSHLPVRCDESIYQLIFHGTVRKHKGINFLLRDLFVNCDASFRVNLRLASQPGLDDLVSAYDSNPFFTIEQIESLSLDKVPFSLANSDLLCLLQDVDSLAAQYQSPAKVSDAVVVSLPILSTKTNTMIELSHYYSNIFFLEDFVDLQSAILAICQISDRIQPSELPSSFSLLSNTLSHHYFSRFIGNTKSVDYVSELICRWLNQRYGSKLSTSIVFDCSQNIAEVVSDNIFTPCFDVVMLWKQHDSFEFMRRHNSFLSAMSRSSSFHQLMHWEPPISRNELYDLSIKKSHIWSDSYKRYQGRCDTKSVHHRTYIYSQKSIELQQVQYQPLSAFRDYFHRENQKYLSSSLPTLLWIYPPFFNFSLIYDSIDHCKVIVDFVDNAILESLDPSVESYIISQYKLLISNSHLCLVNCRGMFDFVSELGGNPLLVENGYPHRSSYQIRIAPDSSLPSFVFIGNMNGRIDWDFVFHACFTYPQYSFEFYGASTINMSVSSIPPNLSILPPVSAKQAYSEILTSKSIGFFPFLNNSKTYYMNPIKFYEFRSLGVPVITSSYHNVPNIPGIFFANNIELMNIQLSQILKHRKNGLAYIPSDDFYRDFSWDSRLHSIYMAILALDK
jgi:hypothetical protein